MPEVSQTLHYRTRTEFWKGHGIGVCTEWLSRRYTLDKSKPLRMVFSDDLKAKDAYVVDKPDTTNIGIYRTSVRFARGPVKTTYLTAGLRNFLVRLCEKWEQGRIAVWFEQDWEE